MSLVFTKILLESVISEFLNHFFRSISQNQEYYKLKNKYKILQFKNGIKKIFNILKNTKNTCKPL